MTNRDALHELFEAELRKHGDPSKLSEPMHQILFMFYKAGADAALAKPAPTRATHPIPAQEAGRIDSLKD